MIENKLEHKVYNGSGIPLVSNYFDCECENDYIKEIDERLPSETIICKKCKMDLENAPNSRLNEVLIHLKAKFFDLDRSMETTKELISELASVLHTIEFLEEYDEGYTYK